MKEAGFKFSSSISLLGFCNHRAQNLGPHSYTGRHRVMIEHVGFLLRSQSSVYRQPHFTLVVRGVSFCVIWALISLNNCLFHCFRGKVSCLQPRLPLSSFCTEAGLLILLSLPQEHNTSLVRYMH